MYFINKILPYLHYLTILAFSLLIISCEEVINIELKSTSPVIVAEGLIEKDSSGWIKLSYTTDYFNNQNPIFVENAFVQLKDDHNNSEIYTYHGNGLYRGTTLKGHANRVYILSIAGPDFNAYATSNLFAPVKIYSVNFELLNLQRPGELKKLYSARIKFSDDLLTENFYMVKFWKNGAPDNNGYTLIRDSYYNSVDTIEYSSWRNTFELGDTVNIRLYSIDKNSFAYYSQLNDISESGMGGSSTPYNPKSNFGLEILGHFGAHSFTSETAIVK
jgi:hypothetical protein